MPPTRQTIAVEYRPRLVTAVEYRPRHDVVAVEYRPRIETATEYRPRIVTDVEAEGF